MMAAAVMTDERLQEVAAFVRSKYKPAQRDDAGQVAYLAARTWRDRYAGRSFARPFTVASAVAFRAATQQMRRAWNDFTVSEHVADGRRAANVGRKVSLYKPASESGRAAREERFAAPDDGPEIGLRGELDRLKEVVRLFRRIGTKERKLLTIVMGDARDRDLTYLARRAKLDRQVARRVLRRFAEAVGQDPVVEHVRRVVSAA